MSVIAARYHGDVDGPDKVPPAPVARSITASSDSLHLPAAGTREGAGRESLVVRTPRDHSETEEGEGGGIKASSHTRRKRLCFVMSAKKSECG